MKSDYSIAFTDPLYTMLPLNYFVCDNQERCTILQDTRFHPLFLWHLKSDLVAAKQFLKLSVGQEAALLEELDAHRLGRFLRSPSQTDQNATMLQQEEVLEEHPESKPQHKTRKRPQTAITEQESTLSACLRLSKHPVFGNAAVKQKDGPPTFQYN